MKLKFLAIAAAATLLPSSVFAQEIIGNLKVYRDANSEIWQGQINEGPLTHLRLLSSLSPKPLPPIT